MGVLNFGLIGYKNSASVRDWGLYDYFISKKIIEPMEEEFQALHDVWEEKLAHLKYSKSYLKFGKKSLSDRKMQLLVKSFSHTARKTKTFMEVQESKRHLMQPGDSSSLNRRDLKVDMDFPDDILKTAFDKWLISTRTQINTSRGDRHVKREFNNSDIEKWVQRQTLPYLDLRLASQYFNCKLNDDEVGYYLFRELPIGVNSRDKLRAIKKRAKQMSDHTVLVSLEACTIEREE